MKKILVILLLLAAPVYAAKFRGTSEALRVPGTQVIQVFDNYSTEGVGIPVDPDFLAIDGSWQIIINGAAPVYEIAIEGSLVSKDGPYEPMSTIDQTTVKLRHWNGKPVPYTQAILNNISGGGSIDLYLIKRGN
jgi:hypothetical protein